MASRGLRMLVFERSPDEKIEEGKIARQLPLAGSQVKSDSEIRVVVSSGLPQVKVPTVVGVVKEEAVRILEGAGLVADIREEAAQGVAANSVARSEPPTGSELTKGAPVTLFVTPAGVKVPNLVGMSQRKAKEAIEAAGLKVGKIRHGYDELKGPYVVLSQKPEADELAEPGGSIDLKINE